MSNVIMIEEIQQLIPHRYPMLMVDRVIDLVPGKSALGLKNVSINEDFFQGHFPTRPLMPGVLIIEAMAQTAGVLVVKSMGKECEGKLVYFMSLTEAKFRKPVVPGDALKIHITTLQNRGKVWKFKGETRVDDAITSEAIFTAMIMDK